jgi:hypothetical protein
MPAPGPWSRRERETRLCRRNAAKVKNNCRSTQPGPTGPTQNQCRIMAIVTFLLCTVEKKQRIILAGSVHGYAGGKQ